jgi:hypothetical protein
MTDPIIIAMLCLALGYLLGHSHGERFRHRCLRCGKRLSPADRADRICSVECAKEARDGLRWQMRSNRKPLTRGRR